VISFADDERRYRPCTSPLLPTSLSRSRLEPLTGIQSKNQRRKLPRRPVLRTLISRPSVSRHLGSSRSSRHTVTPAVGEANCAHSATSSSAASSSATSSAAKSVAAPSSLAAKSSSAGLLALKRAPRCKKSHFRTHTYAAATLPGSRVRCSISRSSLSPFPASAACLLVPAPTQPSTQSVLPC